MLDERLTPDHTSPPPSRKLALKHVTVGNRGFGEHCLQGSGRNADDHKKSRSHTSPNRLTRHSSSGNRPNIVYEQDLVPGYWFY